MLKSSWGAVLAAKRQSHQFARVVPSTGWKGAYHRKPPSGYHKCLSRAEMALVVARLES